jgi:hypothetical protein
VTAFNCKFPDKVILVAPNGAMYPLVIPAAAGAGSAAKPSAAKAPVALKQYDAPWLTIAAKEITPVADSTLEDLSAVTAVQANGKKLVAVLVTPKPAAAGAGAAKSPPKATSIEVEITQELTAKPGAVDIGFQDAKGNLLGTRTLQIAATETTTKGASQ